jgi:arylsulfatase A-like enzyme
MNLIVISSDELRGDTPGFTGNPDCKTPHLDRLAERSVVFTQHFTCHGKCVPSRIAMLTGRYCHTDGIRCIHKTNHLAPGTPNLLSFLKSHGYETAYLGHNHVFENLHTGRNAKGESEPDYHSYTDGDFARLLQTQHPVQQPDAHSVPESHSDAAVNFQTIRHTTPRTGFCDDNRADQAVHYLRTARDRTRPFYLHLNFGAPHPSYAVEEPFFSMYDRSRIVPFEHGMPTHAPLWLKHGREIRTGQAEEKHFRDVQAVYYGMVSKLDTLVGRVVAEIDAQNLWQDTVVMFWVDHGDFAGQYGQPEKWDTAMNDCILRVPQTLCAPSLPSGRRVTSLTEHTDLCPTVLELLGLRPEPEWGLHGASLLPVIHGAPGKSAVFADGGHEASMRARFNTPVSQFNPRTQREEPATQGKQAVYARYPETMARVKMVRTNDWKLCVRETGDHELYDLRHDPNEMRNLWGNGQHADVVLDLQMKLLQWCLRTDTDRPFQDKVGA